MKKWKAIIQIKGKKKEIKMNAKSFPDAYVKLLGECKGGVIKSISEIRTKR